MDRIVSSARLAALLRDAPERSPAYRGLADGIRALVNDGRIPPGTRLPSERDLTTRLGVSRTTVTRAYADLKDRGYLTARVGAGSVVSLPRAVNVGDMLLDPTPTSPGAVNLSCAVPQAPTGVTAAYEAALEELPAHLPSFGYYPSGLPALREEIARRFTERGLETDAEQVIVTSGALSGLAVLVRAFVDHRDRVLMESPTYPNAIRTFRGAGATVAGADIEDTCWATSSLVETIAQLRPTAAYLMPDFHNPTGVLLDDEGRERTAAALRRAHALPIVDEVVAELRLTDNADDASPLPFAAHAPQTLTVGSASKLFWGGLRVGWIRVPRDRITDVITARLAMDLGAPVLEQLATLHLMRRREQIAAIRRDELLTSRTTLVAALARHLPDWRFRVPAGGLSLWVELPQPLSTALSHAAERRGVMLAPGPLFAPEGGLERHLRVPYTQPPDVLEAAVERIAEAWHEVCGPAESRIAVAATPRRHEALVT